MYSISLVCVFLAFVFVSKQLAGIYGEYREKKKTQIVFNLLTLIQMLIWFGAIPSFILYLVKIIDRRVVAVRDTLKAAKANTAETVLIPQVATGVDAVLAEGLEHHLFLGRVLEKVKS